MNLLKSEPVMVSVIVGIVATLAARYGLNLDETQKNALTTVLLLVLGLFARSWVSPVHP